MFGLQRPMFDSKYPGLTKGAQTISGAKTFNDTLTINKTAETGVAETLATFKVSDDATSSITIENATTSNSSFVPYVRFKGPSTNGQYLAFESTTDTGTAPIAAIRCTIGPSTAVAVRPVLQLQRNGGTSLLDFLPLNSGANLALSWGSQTSGAPANLTARPNGLRMILSSTFSSGTAQDYAIGMAANGPYIGLDQAISSRFFNIFAGATNVFSVAGDGQMNVTGRSNLQAGQLVKVRVATTTPITVATTDYFVVSKLAAPGAVAVNLPATPTTGMTIVVQDATGDAAANNITITPAAGNINGAATLVINANYGAKTLRYSGTEWLAY